MRERAARGGGLCLSLCVTPPFMASSGHSCRCGSGLVATESSVWLTEKPQRNVLSLCWGKTGRRGTERHPAEALSPTPTPTSSGSPRQNRLKGGMACPRPGDALQCCVS